MKLILGTKIRATENYESKKEKWLVQVASDGELSRAGLRAAIGIAMHMNRKQRLLAWPGFGRLAKVLGIQRRAVIKGVKDLEARDHMRVVRSRNGTKNNPNHYHPNIWRTGVVSDRTLAGVNLDTRVVSNRTPEPMNEPTREPTIRRREDILSFKDSTLTEDKRLGEEEKVENPHHLGQPKQPELVERIFGSARSAEARPRIDYAAARDLLRPIKPQANRRCPAFLAVTDYLASLAPELPHPLLKRSRDGRFLIESPIGQRSA
jgi:hypothetical protein